MLQRILWVQNGRIDALGTFNELMTSNPAFAEMMSLTAKEEKKKAPSEKSLIVDDEDADSDHIEMEKLVKERSKAAQPAEQESKGLMTMEEKAQKAISWEIYYAYIKASGSILTAPFVILMLCLAQSSNIMSTFWLSYWTSQKFHLSNGVYVSSPCTFVARYMLTVLDRRLCCSGLCPSTADVLFCNFSYDCRH